MSVLGTKREIASYFGRDKSQRDNLATLAFDFIARGGEVSKKPASMTYNGVREVMKDWPNKEFATIIKSAVKEYRFIGKWIRPWDIVPPDRRLDATKVWVGWEMETGFRTREGRSRALDWFDRRVKGGCFDQEGSGEYECEFTFYPTHLEDIKTKGGPNRLIKRLLKGDIEFATHDPDDHIGTHANISTPKSRASTFGTRDSEEYRDYGHAPDDSIDDQIYDIRNSGSCDCEACEADRNGRINVLEARRAELAAGVLPYPGYRFEYEFERAVEDLSGDDCELLFGRSYMYDTICVYHGKQFEFKLFNSTYSIEQWNRYCAVVEQLAEMVKWAEEATDQSVINAREIKKKLLAIKPIIEAMPKGTEPDYEPSSRMRDDDYSDDWDSDPDY